MSRAFACLSDPNKRAAFDRYGSEDPQQAGFGPGMRRRGGAGRQGFGFARRHRSGGHFQHVLQRRNAGWIRRTWIQSAHVRRKSLRWTPVRRTSFRHRQRRRRHAGASDPRVDDTATVIRNILHLAPLLIPLIMWLFTPVERDFALTRSKEHPHGDEDGATGSLVLRQQRRV